MMIVRVFAPSKNKDNNNMLNIFFSLLVLSGNMHGGEFQKNVRPLCSKRFGLFICSTQAVHFSCSQILKLI